MVWYQEGLHPGPLATGRGWVVLNTIASCLSFVLHAVVHQVLVLPKVKITLLVPCLHAVLPYSYKMDV